MAIANIHKNFPKEGVNFVDFGPFLVDTKERTTFLLTIQKLQDKFKFTHIVAVESRGFLIGSMIATILNLPLVMIRKKGKLPGKVFSAEYDLEYGSATLEIQDQELGNVLLVDDVFATGGTITAAKALCEACKATSITGFCLFDIGLTEIPNWVLSYFDLNKTNFAEYGISIMDEANAGLNN